MRTAALFLLLSLSLPIPAIALPCVDYAPHVLPVAASYCPEHLWDFEIAGSIGYALSGITLHVYEFDAQGHATRVGTGTLARPVAGGWLALGGTLGYVGRSHTGLSQLDLVDLSDPLAPAPLTTVPMPAPPRAVVEADGYAFVATAAAGLQVVDIGTPHAPLLVAGAATADEAEDVARLGGLALVAARGAGLVLFDTSDPLAPSELGTLPVPSGELAWRVAAAGPHTAVLATFFSQSEGGRLALVDLTDPAHPAEIGSVPLSGRPARLAVGGGRAYVCHLGIHPLQIVDLEGPGAPSTLARIELGGSTKGMDWLDAGRLVLSSLGVGSSSLSAVRTLEVRSGTFTDALHETSVAEALLGVDGNTALVASSARELQLRDASQPELPVLGSTEFLGHVGAVKNDAERAVVSAGGRLWFLGVEDPGAIVKHAYLTELADTRELGLHQDHVYQSAGEMGVPEPYAHHRIIDVRDPASPVVVFEEPGLWGPFAFRGDHAYVGGDPLRVLDVSDPATPLEVSTIGVEGYDVIDVKTLEDRLVVVLRSAVGSGLGHELRVYDLGTPSSPLERGRLILPLPPGWTLTGPVDELALAPGWAYVTGSGGLQVIRTEPPDSPELIGIVPAGEVDMKRVFANAEHAFVYRGTSSSTDPIGILAHPCPAGPVDAVLPAASAGPLRAFPNPFAVATTIELARPAGRGAAAVVFDVAGRRVVDLTAGLSPGRNSVRWDGRDGAGRAVAAGVYLLQVTDGGGSRSLRIVRLR